MFSRSNKMREQQVFVNVAFDFEYIAEDGKKVFMKENEILLLINKTNHDWWQVIRRGDRRPFYAPAKYVVELRPEEVEALRRKHNAEVAAAATAGDSPPNSLTNQQSGVRLRQPKAMTTFSAVNHQQQQQQQQPTSKLYNGNNKRSSYSPAGQAGVPGGHPLDHFFSNSRFQERYRSNSLDSILVADLNNQASKSSAAAAAVAALPNRNSAVEMKPAVPPPSSELIVHAQQHHFIKKSSPQHQMRTLEKRPTFDGLDKRKSWSVDIKPNNHNRPVERGSSSGNLLKNAKGQTLQQVQQQQQQLLGSSKGRISAYQNTQALFGGSGSANSVGSSSTLETDKRKKPIPLPRSKIPLVTQTPATPPPAAAAAAAAAPAVTVDPPKAAEIKKESLHARFFGKRSKTDLGSDGLAAYKAKKPGGGGNAKYPAPKVPTFNRPVPQKRSDGGSMLDMQQINVSQKRDLRQENNNESQDQDQLISSSRPKPELKEKPLFSTFKTQLSHPPPAATVAAAELDDIIQTSFRLGEEHRLSKAVSESDLKVAATDVELQISSVEPVEPVSITVNSESSEEEERRVDEDCFIQHSKEEAVPDGSINKLVIDTSKSFISSQSHKPMAAAAAAEEEERLPTPPPPPASFGGKSEPLLITTEPLVRDNEPMSESADKSCSTSFDSMDDSLMVESGEFQTSAVSAELVSSPLDESVEMRTKSPSMSTMSRSPPSPTPMGLSPLKQHVVPDWDEYEDGQSGRKFYYNRVTKEKSWKPPRKPRGPNDSGGSGPTSPEPAVPAATEEATTDSIDEMDAAVSLAAAAAVSRQKSSQKEIPNGYELRTDRDTGNSFYVNIFTGVRWFSATDANGKEYFYEENGNESSWCLPNVSQSIQDSEFKPSKPTTVAKGTKGPKKPLTGSTRRIAENYKSMQDGDGGSSSRKHSGGLTKTEMLERKFTLPVSSPNFQIGNVNIVVIKQGPLTKTKLIENGKRHRKNWSSAHVVLTDTFLLFFKDQKTFAGMQSGQSGSNNKPDLCVDLKGAAVDWCAGDKSKRNNVFEVSTVLGLTILLQDESLQTSAEWYQEIRESIEGLERGGVTMAAGALGRKTSEDSGRERKASDTSQSSTLNLPADKRRQQLQQQHGKVSRTKSLKMKILGSNEELEQGGIAPAPLSAPVVSGSNAAVAAPVSNKGNIREKLRKFFQRRPTMDDLFKKGIIKNEPVFGSTLRELHLGDDTEVPLFVKKCVFEIEKGELLKTDGVYRQSGNLSHIQKIRLQVDQGNLSILETVDDVHVLTGALKLFFRELKEPLIPWECVDRLLSATALQNRKQKVRQMRDVIVNGMTPAHRSTLAALLGHLLKVTEFKDFNRMQVPNLAIVFGPTLMWPPAHTVSQNLALDMMQQNIIVEALLNNAQHIF